MPISLVTKLSRGDFSFELVDFYSLGTRRHYREALQG